MGSRIALVVNTVSKNKDVWEMFFDRIEKHIPHNLFNKKYVFVDEGEYDTIPDDYEVLFYDHHKMYRDQFTSCIDKVKEEFCIYISEDYVLYEDVRSDLIHQFEEVLDAHEDLSFVRFIRGGLIDHLTPPYKSDVCDSLYQLYNYLQYFYTNQAALWRTRDLEKIHVHGPNYHIAGLDYDKQFEPAATKTCFELGIQGVYCYYGENKRGLYHYDTLVWPHISTALVKGKWNLSEYPTEMTKAFEEYKIDPTRRGTV